MAQFTKGRTLDKFSKVSLNFDFCSWKKINFKHAMGFIYFSRNNVTDACVLRRKGL